MHNQGKNCAIFKLGYERKQLCENILNLGLEIMFEDFLNFVHKSGTD